MHEGRIRLLEGLTRFRSCSLRVARLLRLAQQVHPFANELAHIGKVLRPRTVVSEKWPREIYRVRTHVHFRAA